MSWVRVDGDKLDHEVPEDHCLHVAFYRTPELVDSIGETSIVGKTDELGAPANPYSKDTIRRRLAKP